MGSQLQQVLRSLCFNSGWRYAVFWTLKHRARMMLTWEDTYYDSNDSCDRKWLNSTGGSFSEGPHLPDPLGLAVAKMPYEVYALGEGIVGQVAVSEKHAWICSDQHVADSSSSSECFGGWQVQFSAGIKTIAVVSVMPHGVVQLGSLHKIAEDLKLVDHIKNVFYELQDSLASCIPNSMKSRAENYCPSDNRVRTSDSAVPGCLARLKSTLHDDEVNLWSQLYSPLGHSGNYSHIFPHMWGFGNETLKMNMQGSVGCSTTGTDVSHPSSSQNVLTAQLGLEETESHNSTKYDGAANDSKVVGKEPEIIGMRTVKNVRIDKSSLSNSPRPTDESQLVILNPPLESLDAPAVRDQDPELSSLQLQQDFENLELPTESSCGEVQILPFSFGAGYELYEALGLSFQKQNDRVWEAGRACSDMAFEISGGMGSCSLMSENSDTHLLDAVVAKVNHKGNDGGSEKSCHELRGSLLTAERTHCSSVATISSAGYSFDKDASSSLNLVGCGVESFKGFSSTSSSRGSETLGRPREAVKSNKKRSRPGESCRPRPRDRQLIQDRIKELRDLIPSGSKCSIDSLLERTIKHMLFLQSITKHAEKLNKCSASKDAGMRRFSCHEQGSSWAMEVGNDQKVYPIIVENINMNGQMLVEMLCDECSQFLEIAEAIRSLGLTILKGVSEAYGNKTWLCYVVENNRGMHRMDILWSLMQLLQPKVTP